MAEESGGTPWGAVGSIVGTGADVWMQGKANRATKKLAREQMRFQKIMSNTAHQREVEDLEAAGLNPILSATGGSGATTPGGASATMENTAKDLGRKSKEITEAMQQIKQSKAHVRNTDEDTVKKGKEGDRLDKEINEVLPAQINAINAQAAQANSAQAGMDINNRINSHKANLYDGAAQAGFNPYLVEQLTKGLAGMVGFGAIGKLLSPGKKPGKVPKQDWRDRQPKKIPVGKAGKREWSGY